MAVIETPSHVNCSYVVKANNYLNYGTTLNYKKILGTLQTMVKSQKAVNFHQSDCKNQGVGLSTLHIRGQSPKVVALQNGHMTIFVYQGKKLSKEVWVGHERKPKLWSRG
jgi:hypothetical protein